MNIKPFEKLSKGKAKLYFVNFYKKEDNSYHFSKNGITRFVDAADRFRYEPDQYRHWTIKVLFSVIGPENLIKKEEDYLKSLYKKDFWLPDDLFFKGITEIRKYNRSQISEIIMYMKGLKYKLTVNTQQVKKN